MYTARLVYKYQGRCEATSGTRAQDTFLPLLSLLSLSRSLSLSRAALSRSHTRLSLSPRYLRLPSRIVSGSFRPIIRPSLLLGPLPQCIPHRTQHGFSSVVRFLSGYISSGTSARVWPLDLYFPSFSSPPPSRLLFFPFPFASGHFLSCEANWYPNGSGVFLTLFVSSVYPPLRDPRPEFGVSLPVVSFFWDPCFSCCPFSFAHGIQQIRVSCTPLTARACLFATDNQDSTLLPAPSDAERRQLGFQAAVRIPIYPSDLTQPTTIHFQLPPVCLSPP